MQDNLSYDAPCTKLFAAIVISEKKVKSSGHNLKTADEKCRSYIIQSHAPFFRYI